MKRITYCLTMAVFLAVSCVQEDTSFLYSGEYLIGKETSVVRNTGPVSNPETVYADASVGLSVISGNDCTFILRNIITGQPEVEIAGTTEIIYGTGSSNKEELVFSGKKSTDDRIVEVNGMIRDTVLTQLYINESVTSEVVGKWKTERISVKFNGHAETDSIINEILSGFQKSVQEDSFIEFTSYGYVCSENIEMENILEYYLRPNKKLLNFHVNRSVAEIFIRNLDQELVELLKAVGLSDILNANQSLSLPVYYSADNGNLVLYTDQSLTDFYISLMREALEAISGEIEKMSYGEMKEFLSGSFLDRMITEDNYLEYRTAILDVISILSGGREEYSMSILLSPFNE